MLHVVDFRTSAGDTGRANSDSIQPVADGESADQVVLRRPMENNRVRTQTLRDLVRESRLRHDFGSSYLYSTSLITPDITMKKFTIGSDIYVLPKVTAGTDASMPYLASTKSSLSIGTPSSNELVLTSVQKAYEGSSAAADVNAISAEINDGGSGASLAITVTDLHIQMTIDAGVHNVNDVIGLIAGDVGASALVVGTVGSGSTGTNACDVFDATTWTSVSDRFLRGGVPGISHKITPAGLATFFATAANEMELGDTIAIEYDQLVSLTTTGGRLQSTTENTNTDVSTALFNARRYPAKVPNCIPLCKRIDGSTIMFANGAVFNWLMPGYLYWDSIALLGAATGYAEASSWQRMDTGTVHNPPDTIQEALDNADGHIDAILDEIEPARNSALLGAKSDLDARLEAEMDHIGRTVVTVSDGTNSTGGMYNGTTALQNAITALGAGRTYLVRKGTYTISANNVFTARTRIIAQDAGAVTLNVTVGSGYAFAFNAGADGSLIEGCNFTTSGTLDLLNVAGGVRNVTFRDGTLTGSISSSGKNIRIEGITFNTTVDAVVLGGTAHTIIEGCVFNITSCTIAGITMDAGGTNNDKQLVIRNCVATIANGSYRFIYTGANSHQTTIDGLVLTCSPFTDTTRSLIELQGDQLQVNKVRIILTGTGTILQSIMRMTGTGSVTDVDADFGNYDMNYGASKQPLKFTATNGPFKVKNLKVHNWNWVGDNINMQYYPVVTLIASNGRSSMICEGLNVYDLGGTGTPTVSWNGVIVGSERTGSVATGVGEWVIRNADFDTTGTPYHGLLDSLYLIANIPSFSLVEGNRIFGTDGGCHCIVSEGGHSVTIKDNCIRLGGTLNLGYVILVKGGSASDDPDWANVESNRIYHGQSRWGGSAVPLYVWGWTSAERPKITNNTVQFDGAGTAPGQSIAIEDTNKATLFHNNVSHGFTYWGTNTAPLPVFVSLGTYNQLV